MNIKDSCCCGAEVEFVDSNAALALGGHRDWLKSHEVCRLEPVPSSLMTGGKDPVLVSLGGDADA